MRPIPEPDADSAPFWAFVAKHELRAQRCIACRAWRHPPRPTCPACTSFDHSWEPLSGRGVVWSWIVAHPPLLPAFAERAPYNVAVIELEEGIRMVGHVAGVANDEIRVGMEVVVEFEDLGGDADGTTLPAWRRAP